MLQELDQQVIDTNHDLIGKVFERMGSEPGRLATHYPQVAFIENGNKLAVVKRRGCKPRLALFALLKLFAPGYDPSDLFYKKGLREFLAACGVRGPSRTTLSQDRVLHEGTSEGPLQGLRKFRRIFSVPFSVPFAVAFFIASAAKLQAGSRFLVETVEPLNI